MTTFDERERAFEKKFAHDAEMQFMAESRRMKRLALWAGARMGHEGEANVAYAREVMIDWLRQPGVDHVIDRLAADLARAGTAVGRDEIAARAAGFLGEAKSELLGNAE